MGIKYPVNEEFFNNWTPEMAYVLGYIYADGSLEDASYLRGKYVRVTSVEKKSILRIKKWLDSKHTIVAHPSIWANGKMRYTIRIGSHKLYNSLLNLGLYPNKSLTIKFPEIPTEYLNSFVRGYLDGDGCVYLQRSLGKRHKLIVKKLSTIFTSGSKEFLEKMNETLKEAITVKQNKVYTSQRSFQLRYATADSIKLFKFIYKNAPKNCYFQRKVKTYLNYFKLRPSKIDPETTLVLQHLKYHGVVAKKQTQESAKLPYVGASPTDASKTKI